MEWSYCSAKMASFLVCSSFSLFSTALWSDLGVDSSRWFLRALYCLVWVLHVSWNCFLIWSSLAWERKKEKEKYWFVVGTAWKKYMDIAVQQKEKQLPWGFWAVVWPPLRACASAPSPSSCYIPADWWAPSGAVCGWAQPVPSEWCPSAGTPVPALTHGAWATWHVPGPSESDVYWAPANEDLKKQYEKTKQKTI